MTRSAITALACLAVLIGCASPGLLLTERGEAHLVADSERVVLSPDDALVVHWADDDTTHSTADLSRKGRGAGLVRLVEASSQFLHVWSDGWDEPGDLTEELLRGELRLVPRSGRYHHPTVLIPVERITSVEVYGLLPRLQRPRWRDAWHGMAGGAGGAMASFAASSGRFLPMEDDGSGYLLGTALAGVIGGVAVPVYHLFPPRYADESQVYPVNSQDGYRIEIGPRR